jgi:hypothetical protein
MMQLSVGHRAVKLPSRPCFPDDVRKAVERINCPFVVSAGLNSDQRFSVRRRVFISIEDVRVECENNDELHLACKLVAESHNRWQDGQNQRCIDETELMERESAEKAEQESSSSGDEAQSDEDISIQEWGQMGYKWFKREDVAYI